MAIDLDKTIRLELERKAELDNFLNEIEEKSTELVKFEYNKSSKEIAAFIEIDGVRMGYAIPVFDVYDEMIVAYDRTPEGVIEKVLIEKVRKTIAGGYLGM